MAAVTSQSDSSKIHSVNQYLAVDRVVKRTYQADDRRLTRTRRSDQRGHGARRGIEGDTRQHRLFRLVGKSYIFKRDMSLQFAWLKFKGAPWIAIFFRFRQHFAGAIYSGDRLRDLRSQRNQLEGWSYQVGQEDVVSDITSQTKFSAQHLAR